MTLEIGNRAQTEGDEFMARGDFSRAYLTYQSMVAVDEKNIPARIGMAAALLSLGQLDQGGEVLGSLDPGMIEDKEELGRYWFWVADWQAKRGEADRAISALDGALAAELPDALRGRLGVMAARTFLQKGDTDSAMRRTRSAGSHIESLTPEDKRWLANVSLLCGDTETGWRAARSAMNTLPGLGTFYLLGYAGLARLGFLGKLGVLALCMALLLTAPAGWVGVGALLAFFALGAIIGWRTRLGAVLVGSAVYGGALLLALALVWLWLTTR